MEYNQTEEGYIEFKADSVKIVFCSHRLRNMEHVHKHGTDELER